MKLSKAIDSFQKLGDEIREYLANPSAHLDWEEVAKAKGGSVALIESIYYEQLDEDTDQEHKRIDAIIVPERDLSRLPITLWHETNSIWIYHFFSRGDIYDGQEWFGLEDRLQGTFLRSSWPSFRLVRKAEEQSA